MKKIFNYIYLCLDFLTNQLIASNNEVAYDFKFNSIDGHLIN